MSRKLQTLVPRDSFFINWITNLTYKAAYARNAKRVKINH
jgi:hypothetical protein